jgi:hypothetical protein
MAPTIILTSAKTTPEAQTTAALRVVLQTDLYELAQLLYGHLTPNC